MDRSSPASEHELEHDVNLGLVLPSTECRNECRGSGSRKGCDISSAQAAGVTALTTM